MRTRTLLIVGMTLLLAPSVLLSTEQSPASGVVGPEPEVAKPHLAPAREGTLVPPIITEPVPGPPAGRAIDSLETRIFGLRYRSAIELADLIRAVTGEQEARTIVADERNNGIIVTATPERLQEIERLIERLDTSGVPAAQSQNLMCRVYVLEIPSKDQNLKGFCLVLERASPLPAAEVYDTLKDADLQIGTFLQSNEWGGSDKWQLVIQGRAASSDALKRMTAKIPESQVKELRWDDETFTSAIVAAQVSRMPVPLQEYMRKFLGAEVQTVGYWFGGLSVPGDIRAPLGPWTLELKAKPSQETDLSLEVKVNQDAPVPFIQPITILSNAVQGRIGKPIVIGYNRQAYGARKMGVVVIIPENVTLVQSEEVGESPMKAGILRGDSQYRMGVQQPQTRHRQENEE